MSTSLSKINIWSEHRDWKKKQTKKKELDRYCMSCERKKSNKKKREEEEQTCQMRETKVRRHRSDGMLAAWLEGMDWWCGLATVRVKWWVSSDMGLMVGRRERERESLSFYFIFYGSDGGLWERLREFFFLIIYLCWTYGGIWKMPL